MLQGISFGIAFVRLFTILSVFETFGKFVLTYYSMFSAIWHGFIVGVILWIAFTLTRIGLTLLCQTYPTHLLASTVDGGDHRVSCSDSYFNSFSLIFNQVQADWGYDGQVPCVCVCARARAHAVRCKCAAPERFAVPGVSEMQVLCLRGLVAATRQPGLTANTTDAQQMTEVWFLYLVVYFAFNVVLMNLFIALMASTYENCMETAKRTWIIQRYVIASEYSCWSLAFRYVLWRR